MIRKMMNLSNHLLVMSQTKAILNLFLLSSIPRDLFENFTCFPLATMKVISSLIRWSYCSYSAQSFLQPFSSSSFSFFNSSPSAPPRENFCLSFLPWVSKTGLTSFLTCDYSRWDDYSIFLLTSILLFRSFFCLLNWTLYFRTSFMEGNWMVHASEYSIYD